MASPQILALSLANIHLTHERASKFSVKILCTIMLDIGFQFYKLEKTGQGRNIGSSESSSCGLNLVEEAGELKNIGEFLKKE